MARLGLGTVQFGLNYGITNKNGQLTTDGVQEILTIAETEGIEILDTATAYGNSEQIIGRFSSGKDVFKIVTKILPVAEAEITQRHVQELNDRFQQSLGKFGRKRIYGLLIQSVEDVFKPGGEKLIEALRTLKEECFVEKIGVSVYNSKQIDKFVTITLPDLIQLPLNVFDQRLLQSGHIEKLKVAGVEIHARSIFLQGVLLNAPEYHKSFFSPYQPFLDKWADFVNQQGKSRLELALNFVMNQPAVDVALVGVGSLAEFKDILTVSKNRSEAMPDFKSLACDQEKFINPALWPLT